MFVSSCYSPSLWSSVVAIDLPLLQTPRAVVPPRAGDHMTSTRPCEERLGRERFLFSFNHPNPMQREEKDLLPPSPRPSLSLVVTGCEPHETVLRRGRYDSEKRGGERGSVGPQFTLPLIPLRSPTEGLRPSPFRVLNPLLHFRLELEDTWATVF